MAAGMPSRPVPLFSFRPEANIASRTVALAEFWRWPPAALKLPRANSADCGLSSTYLKWRRSHSVFNQSAN